MIRRLARPAATLLVLAAVFRVESLLGVGVAVGMWMLSGWLVPRAAIRGVEATRSHPARVMWGDRFDVVLDLTSESRLRWMSLIDVTPFDLGDSDRAVVSLGPGAGHTRSRSIVARRRGLHTLGPTMVTTGDLFSIGSHDRQVGGTGHVLVYPQLVPVGSIAVTPESPDPVLPTMRPLFFDPHRIRGVRDYRPGDPMRAIHWTSSAASGALVVKELEPAITEIVVVSVDMAQGSHPRSGRHRSGELAVIVGASLASHFVNTERRPVGIRLAGLDAVTGQPVDVDRPPRGDHAHLMETLEYLARIRLDRERAVHGLLDPQGLGFGTSLFHVAGLVTPEAASALAALRRSGVSVHVIVTGGPPTDAVASMLQAERIGVAVIDRSSDLGVDR